MRKIAMGAIASMMLLLLGASLTLAKARTFTGEITDSQCAKNGSHAMMLKKNGMGNMDPNSLMAKKMCTQKCVKNGGKYVLYSATRKYGATREVVYQLDDQQKPAEFAGQKVKVTGSYDQATKTIHVVSIQAAP
jgi:hypothetical protein